MVTGVPLRCEVKMVRYEQDFASGWATESPRARREGLQCEKMKKKKTL